MCANASYPFGNNGFSYGYNTLYNGLHGYNGLLGYNGYNGLHGYNGYNGLHGYNGYNGYNGYPYNHYGYGYTASQYRTQDEFGQGSYGYSYPGQAANNHQDAWGNQVGSYAYISPEGKEIRVSYVADANGFRVVSNALPEGPSALPAPVTETPEVAAATKEHLAAVAAAQSGAAPAAPVNPVQDTPEVMAAKMEHAEAHKKAADMAAAWRKKRGAVFAPLTYAHAAPYAVHYAAATPVREAVLTKTVLNPGHAVAYRVY